MAALPPPPVPNTVERSLIICGVRNRDTNNVIWNGSNAAERIAEEVFNGSFESFMDLQLSELDDSWRTYGQLTIGNGQIRLRPATKSNIKALLQWVRDCMRLNIDMTTNAFPVGDKPNLLQRYFTHKQWMEDAPNMIKTALPKQFTEKSKWSDWKVTFVGFLRTQPGRHGVPLSYVIRENANARITMNPDFMDDYVNSAPLAGMVFIMDSSKVHSYLLRMISDNPVAEQKVLPFKDTNDGRQSYNALLTYYEGVGANAKAITTAERDLKDLFYLGEKRPHMWWDEFEVRLTNAYAIVDKNAGREVYTDEMKLRTLNEKV